MSQYTYTTPTFITEALQLSTLYTAVLNDPKVTVTAIQPWASLIMLVSTTCFYSMVTTTNDTDYSCYCLAVEFFNQSYCVHIMPYHANSYQWPREQIHTYVNTHIHKLTFWTKAIRKPGTPGLKILHICLPH